MAGMATPCTGEQSRGGEEQRGSMRMLEITRCMQATVLPGTHMHRWSLIAGMVTSRAGFGGRMGMPARGTKHKGKGFLEHDRK